MPRLGWVALILFAFPQAISAQTDDALGLKLSPVPEALYTHLPHLPKNSLLVEDALVDSPVFQGGLRRHDILIGVDGKAPKSADELLDKLRDSAGKKLVLSICRQGKERNLVFALPTPDQAAKSYYKPGSLPPVTVKAEPLRDGKLAVTISYYTDKSSKLKSITCQAAAEDLERRFHDLAMEEMVPEHVQDLVDVALRRLRELNAPQKK